MKRVPWNCEGGLRFVLVPESETDRSDLLQSLETLGISSGEDFVAGDLVGRLAVPTNPTWEADGALVVSVVTDGDEETRIWFWIFETDDSGVRRASWSRSPELENAEAWESAGLVKADESAVEKLINSILDKGLSGFPPLSSAANLAQEYQIDQSYENDDERVDALINWETSKNFTSGFLTGLGGIASLPVAVPAALGAAWLIQARMAAAIAGIYGHDLRDDRVRTLVLISIAGDAAKEVLKRFGIGFGRKLTAQVVRQIPGRLLIEINKKIGFRLLAKTGEKSLVVLTKLVPVVGGFVGGTFDAVACRAVGRVAKDLFRPPESTETL